MKNIIYLAVIIALIITTMLSIKGCLDAKKGHTELVTNLKPDSTQHYKNKLGQLVAETKVITGERQDMLIVVKDLEQKLKDNNIKPKSVSNYTGIKISVRDTIRVKPDTCITLAGDTLIRNTEPIITEQTAGIDLITHWKRDKWYKSKNLVITAVSDNENIVVDNIRNYKVEQKKKFYETRLFALGVGLLAGIILIQ